MFQTDEGNIFFEEKIESDPISLIYGPIFDVVSHVDYVYVNESIILPISFLAKPMPNIERISWQVLSGDIIQIMQPGDVSFSSYFSLCTYICTNANPALSDSEATLKFEFCMLKNTTHTDFQLKISTPGILAAIRSYGKRL